MHVIKVPVVHKFGIISHCQRLQLQTRLFEEISQDKIENVQSSTKTSSFEVSDELVDKYNSVFASSFLNKDLKRDMRDKIEKIFLKIKRRIGLQYNCEGESHINLALGWTELSILSQCDGDIGQDSLDLLLMSLNVAPMSNRAFSVLFYLLETVLYFIQVQKLPKASPQKHIKWLLIGEIVSVRIYLQCVLRLSQSWKEKLDNLVIYIKDFKKCQEQFAQYPELALSFCVIEEVTDHLIKTADIYNSRAEEDKKEERLKFHCGSFLWHAVDLCRCFAYSSFRSQAQDCINGIRNCMARETTLGEWIECYLAVRVIGSAAALTEQGLEVFISLARGLADANQEKMKKNGLSGGGTAGLKRGTLLLMTAMRELATIPVVARKSLVRERSLSTIAELLVSKNPGIAAELPLEIQEVVVSRMEATLVVCDQNEDNSSLSVIKNSVWSLLGAVKRKRLLSASEEDFSEAYGKVLASSLYSKLSNELPQTANMRISDLLIQYLLPVFPIPGESDKTPSSVHRQHRTLTVPLLSEKQRLKITEAKKKTPVVKRESCYERQADVKLRSILENYWTQELPKLEKSLDETEIESEST